MFVAPGMRRKRRYHSKQWHGRGDDHSSWWILLWLCAASISCTHHHDFGKFLPNPTPVVATDGRSCAKPWEPSPQAHRSQFTASRSNCLDLIIIIQNSGSAAVAPGTSSTRSLDKSFFTAEMQAVEALLPGLDPTTVAVGLVTTAADRAKPDQLEQVAATVVSLTNDFDAVRLGLQRIRDRGPAGAGHLAAALDRSTTELIGLEGARSSSTGGGQRAVLILTNGFVGLPYGPGYDDSNHDAVKRAADRAKRGGSRLVGFPVKLTV